MTPTGRTRVVLTVDTEPSVGGALGTPGTGKPVIHEPVWGEVAGRSEALGFLLRVLGRYGLTATFFVETVHTTVFPDHVMGAYVDRLTEAGQDVQLHLHPVWLNFRDGAPTDDAGSRVSGHCDRLPAEVLDALIDDGAARIGAWTGRRATGLRTGNFSTNRGVFAAMRRTGLAVSSNICAGVRPPPEPELRVGGGAIDVDGVVELPVTCFRDESPLGRGRLRALQVTACTFAEVAAALEQLHAAGGQVAVIVTHPFEYLKSRDAGYADMRANRLVQGRFERLCAFLASNDDRFETTTLEAAARAIEPPVAPPPLVGGALPALVRAAQNFVNDRLL